MHLHTLILTNVRQFDQRTFKFQTGFNLLVGENGSGKTTILRGLLAALGSARQMGRRPRLEDDDIRLHTGAAEIRAVVRHSNNGLDEFIIQKTLWEPETRLPRRGKLPLTLLYSSNEAICSAMKMKPAKRIRNVESDSFRRSEEFLYASDKEFSQRSAVASERQFGNSQSVRRFVNSVLATFSPDMGDFYWRFEPYDCSIVPAESSSKMLSLNKEVRNLARSYAIRWFNEERARRKRPIIWPDQAKVILTPKDSEQRDGYRYLPSLYDIWKDMRVSPSIRELLLSYSLEVKLTPRIMIERKIGTLSINQLSDGEQRLFSLFVDIARQLSINNSDDRFGEGEAIILIDEIDVHLHPKWQRRIVPALEDLFPNCQFIATTHSPFVIQATNRQQITSIDPGFSASGGVGNSIEDIVEEIQGVSVPQRSIRAERLSAAAEKYFTLLERQAASSKQANSTELRAAERSYREASEPFSSDAAVHALLKVLAKSGKVQ